MTDIIITHHDLLKYVNKIHFFSSPKEQRWSATIFMMSVKLNIYFLDKVTEQNKFGISDVFFSKVTE